MDRFGSERAEDDLRGLLGRPVQTRASAVRLKGCTARDA